MIRIHYGNRCHVRKTVIARDSVWASLGGKLEGGPGTWGPPKYGEIHLQELNRFSQLNMGGGRTPQGIWQSVGERNYFEICQNTLFLIRLTLEVNQPVTLWISTK